MQNKKKLYTGIISAVVIAVVLALSFGLGFALRDAQNKSNTNNAIAVVGAGKNWSDSTDTVYYIGSPADLDLFRIAVNKDGRTFAGCTVYVTQDIVLTDTAWVPIGNANTETNTFKGTFDGQGFTISSQNSTCGFVGSGANGVFGFFGYSYGCTIKNLNLNRLQPSNTTYIGGLIGRLMTGTVNIEGCTVTFTEALQGTYIGGLVGYTDNSASVINISSSSAETLKTVSVGQHFGGMLSVLFNYGTLNVDNSTFIACDTITITGGSAGYGLGGILGYAYGSSSSYVKKVTITNTKVISSGDFIASSSAYVGGMIGYAYVYSTSDVFVIKNSGVYMPTGTIKSSTTTGGLVGVINLQNASSFEISDCEVVAKEINSTSSNAGGFIGDLSNSSNTADKLLIKNNTASVEKISAGTGNVDAGGFIGSASICGCSLLNNNAYVDTITRVSSSNYFYSGGYIGYLNCYGSTQKMIDGGYFEVNNFDAVASSTQIYMGGVFGYLNVQSSASNIVIKNILSNVNINSISYHTGGFVGYFYINTNCSDITVQECTVNISNMNTTSSNKTGGFVGYFYNYYQNTNIILDGCDVNITNLVSDAPYTGGFIGYYESGSSNSNYPQTIINDCNVYFDCIKAEANRSDIRLGGFIGYFERGRLKIQDCGVIKNSTADGGIILNSQYASSTSSSSKNPSLNTTGNFYLGGMVGCSSGILDIENSQVNINNGNYGLYNYGYVSSTARFTGTGGSYNVYAYARSYTYTGGLVGYANNSNYLSISKCIVNMTNINKGIESNSYSVATASGGNNYVYRFAWSYTGGLVGWTRTVNVDNCKVNIQATTEGIMATGNAGNSHNSNSTSYSDGDICVSGGIGWVETADSDTIFNNFTNSYISVNKISANSSWDYIYAGGFLGRSDNKMTTMDNLYLENTHIYADFTYNINSSYYCYMGGIATSEDCNMTNIKIVNSSLTATKDGGDFTGTLYAGGLRGSGSGVTVSNCDIQIDINAFSTYSNNYVGGLIGNGYATTTNCKVSGDIVGGNYAGGLYGTFGGSYAITDCEFTGSVSGTQYVGGIVAQGYGTWTNLYVNATVTGLSYTSTQNVGGIVGQNQSTTTIKNAFVQGEISGNSTTTERIGGMAGYGSSATFYDCLNTASVSCSNNTSTNKYAGGISGYYGTAYRCGNLGQISGYFCFAMGRDVSSNNCFADCTLITGYTSDSTGYYGMTNTTNNNGIYNFLGTYPKSSVDNATALMKTYSTFDERSYFADGQAWAMDGTNNYNGYPIILLAGPTLTTPTAPTVPTLDTSTGTSTTPSTNQKVTYTYSLQNFNTDTSVVNVSAGGIGFNLRAISYTNVLSGGMATIQMNNNDAYLMEKNMDIVDLGYCNLYYRYEGDVLYIIVYDADPTYGTNQFYKVTYIHSFFEAVDDHMYVQNYDFQLDFETGKFELTFQIEYDGGYFPRFRAIGNSWSYIADKQGDSMNNGLFLYDFTFSRGVLDMIVYGRYDYDNPPEFEVGSYESTFNESKSIIVSSTTGDINVKTVYDGMNAKTFITPTGSQHVHSIIIDNQYEVEIAYYRATIYEVGSAYNIEYSAKTYNNTLSLDFEGIYDDIEIVVNLVNGTENVDLKTPVYSSGASINGVVVKAQVGGEARIVGNDIEDSSVGDSEEVTLVAVAYKGYKFVGWIASDESDIPNADQATLRVTKENALNKIFIAQFVKVSENIDINDQLDDNLTGLV